MEGEWITGQVDENGIADKIGTVDEGIAYSNTYEVEEGEWIPDADDENRIASRSSIDEGTPLFLHVFLICIVILKQLYLLYESDTLCLVRTGI